MSFYAVMDEYDEGLDETSLVAFTDLDSAVAYSDDPNNPDAKVFEVREVPESQMWDWGLREAGTANGPVVYTGARAARASLREGLELVKCRLGTHEWVRTE